MFSWNLAENLESTMASRSTSTLQLAVLVVLCSLSLMWVSGWSWVAMPAIWCIMPECLNSGITCRSWWSAVVVLSGSSEQLYHWSWWEEPDDLARISLPCPPARISMMQKFCVKKFDRCGVQWNILARRTPVHTLQTAFQSGLRCFLCTTSVVGTAYRRSVQSYPMRYIGPSPVRIDGDVFASPNVIPKSEYEQKSVWRSLIQWKITTELPSKVICAQ